MKIALIVFELFCCLQPLSVCCTVSFGVQYMSVSDSPVFMCPSVNPLCVRMSVSYWTVYF